VVYAHPQALAQCQGWLTTHLPNAERRAASSNAEGARLAATNPAWAGHCQRTRWQ
jgi:chorismate mutase/prephenate dehydratase